MKFKFNWGWGIAIFYSLFVIVMLLFVYFSLHVDHSLERNDYYVYDIGFEKLIGQKMRNSSALKEKVKLVYDQDNAVVVADFPDSMANISGQIWFYRPDNENLDKKIEIKTGQKNIQLFNAKALKNGQWNVNIDWKSGGKEYLDKFSIYIQ